MILHNLIDHLIDEDSVRQFLATEKVDPELDISEVQIYMKDKIAPESELKIFTIAETDGVLNYNKDGVTYKSLFDFAHILELMDMLVLRDSSLSKEEIEDRLVYYCIYDA